MQLEKAALTLAMMCVFNRMSFYIVRVSESPFPTQESKILLLCWKGHYAFHTVETKKEEESPLSGDHSERRLLRGLKTTLNLGCDKFHSFCYLRYLEGG